MDEYVGLQKFKKIEQMQDLDIINLGTGMGYYDFCYDDIPLNAFNFSLPQQGLYFDYQLLINYSNLMKRNCIVCIILPYFIFCADKLDNVMMRNERYYTLLPKEAVEPYCSTSYEEWLLKERILSTDNDCPHRSLSSDEMRMQTEEALANWKRSLKIISYTTGEVSSHTKKEIEKTRQWLKKILDYCEQMEFVPVIVVPPMSRSLLDKISLRFRQVNFYDVLKETVPQHIQLLDYSEDSFFCNPKLYFWPGFLTADAAKVFTKDVLQKLNIGQGRFWLT